MAIPPGEGVDEAAHLDYVRHVKEKRALPIQPVTREAGVEVWMGHHPPLYYVLGALAISWTDTGDFDKAFRPNPHFVWRENDGRNGWNVMSHFGQDEFPWHGSVLSLQIMRLLGVALACVALYAIYRSAELMFPEHPWIALGVAAVVAFNPAFIFMSSTVHHDVLQMTIFALAVWWLMRFLKKPERPYDAILAGLLVGAAMLTKLSGLALALVMGLALFAQALRDQDWRSFVRRSLVSYGTALLLAGWWYLRNLLLYGDMLGWRMFLNIHSHMVRTTTYDWRVFVDEFLGQVGRTYWGGFGFMHITFPETTRYLWWLAGMSLAGLIVTLARKQLSLRRRWAEALVLIALLGILFLSFVRFSISTVGAGHGRYLFPAGFSVGVLVVVGLNSLSGWRLQRSISMVLALGLLAFTIWLPVAMVLPKYSPPLAASDERVARATPVEKQLADGVQLVAYELGAERIVPGQSLPVSLYWQATGNPERRQDPEILLAIIDNQGVALAEFIGWPVPSLPPALWSPGKPYVTQTTLRTPPHRLPGKLFVAIEPRFGSAEEARVELAGDNRILLAEVPTAGATSFVSLDAVPNALDAVLDGRIALSGYELSADSVTAGDDLQVTIYWRALHALSEQYTSFVHLLDNRGQLVAQYDRPAGGDALPTTSWPVGQTLRDTYPLAIPEDATAGDYSLHVGMYRWPALERLPTELNGKLAGTSISLGTIEISR